MFKALLPLLETATVTLIVTQTDKDSRCLRITVIPKPNDDKADKELYRAFHVEATVNELDHPEGGFAKLLGAERESRKGLEIAISDLKQADADLAQSKKIEADRKRSQAKQVPKATTEAKTETQQKAPAMQSLFGGDDEDTNS
jgi:PRTRC genetic system protein E